MKECRTCGNTKEDDEFSYNRRVCKDCDRARCREYRRNNKDKARKWAEENKDRMKELQSDWYKANKQKINSKFRQRYHDSTTDFKRVKNYRTAVNHMLGGTQKTNQYIGCERDQLVEWCEFCFQEGMMLENYGTYWVVDHVVPLDTLRYSPGLFDQVVKWNNISPVTMEFNLTKNKRFDPCQAAEHMLNVVRYSGRKSLPLDEAYFDLLARLLDAGNP